MGLTDYENKIFKWLIESHQKWAGLAKLYFKNVKCGLVDLEKVERNFLTFKFI